MFALAVDKTTPFGTNATPRAVNGACVRPAHGLHVMRHHRRACATELAGTAGTRKPDRSAVVLGQRNKQRPWVVSPPPRAVVVPFHRCSCGFASTSMTLASSKSVASRCHRAAIT